MLKNDSLEELLMELIQGMCLTLINNTEEKELQEYLIQANKVGYGKTRCQVKMIAEKVAIDKGLLRGAQISDG